MRNKLSNLTENLIRLAALERVQQLEKKSDNLNVIDKSLELTRLADEIILRANKAPLGLVEVVFTKKQSAKKQSVEEILLHSDCRISGFNTSDPDNVSSLFRTVIIVDPKWSTDIKVYGCEYGLPTSFLR
jgi:hypothetical protein